MDTFKIRAVRRDDCTLSVWSAVTFTIKASDMSLAMDQAYDVMDQENYVIKSIELVSPTKAKAKG
jgi:hypothetical protein